MIPLVSICVQTYNHKDYIKQCLDGILMQKTDFSFEIILGEDESNDGTREICKQYASKHTEKIRLFLRSRKDVIYINGRPTGRYNFIENLKACKGKYIALCEGDDYWINPLKLQKQVDFLEKNQDFRICYHAVKIYNQGKQEFIPEYNTREVEDITTINDLAQGNYINTPSVLIRNEIKIPKWFTKCALGDWTFYMLVVNSSKIMKMPEEMAVYRVHTESIWSGKSVEQRMIDTNKNIKILILSRLFNEKVNSILIKKLNYYNSKLDKSQRITIGKFDRHIFRLKYGQSTDFYLRSHI
ncbi:glycosyltransferase [Winogradskyella maritima]|uniref:Glycosyltransferase family 2 protein n=1 Tax=Winogradskyella maritima TaxID=1517766 RepID=A0ABV8AGT4_9FLAO|nr:glycosyltransferase [Winogradskyella maritima]